MGFDPSTGRLELKYPVIYEATESGFSAYVPDLQGCVAAGESLDETRDLIAGAIAIHIAGMREDGAVIPEPSVAELVEVAV
jgi:predicted RNase H-like HicB family nuclease